MKLLHIAILVSALWLAGCASVNNGSSGSSQEGGAHSGGTLSSVPTKELRSDKVAELAAPKDLWERIRRGFAIPNLDNPLVHQDEQWYLSRPDYIARMTDRSRLYLFHIVEELEVRDMPTELALLPFIESAFNPQALSSAKAAGLWQFIPSTGTSFDLRQNTLRDDRRNILASTRAALDYLQQLHDQFGDWQLALAAYNWGPGNVQKAIAANQAAGLGTTYSDLKMPEETRNYVPKLQAIKNIIATPQAFGAMLPDIGNHPYFDTVTITHDIDVDMAARLAEVGLDDFKALNPSQRKPTIFAAGTPQILLPWDNVAIFKSNLAQTNPARLASWTTWVAPKTMPAREVAQQVGMSDRELREINNIPQRVLVKQGSTLLVRRTEDDPTTAASSVVNNAHVAYAPEITLRRTIYRAHRGDSIASIAERYDLPAATVARWNKSHPGTHLKRGHAVVLYLPSGTRVASAAGSSREPIREAAKEPRRERHRAPQKSGRKEPAKARVATKSHEAHTVRVNHPRAPARKSVTTAKSSTAHAAARPTATAKSKASVKSAEKSVTRVAASSGHKN
jgi:membrane-bound lytic murein transglycosylase D